jgi:hypothetical protein
LTVTDEDGKLLVESDDDKDNADPTLLFTAAADGHFRATIRDVADAGGATHFYRLNIAPVTPDFALSLATDNFLVSSDKPLEIPIAVDRRDGFAEPIAVRVIGLPPGVFAEEAISQPTGDSAKQIKLALKLTPEFKDSVSVPIRIEGSSGEGGQLHRRATFALGLPLAGEHHAVWLIARR